MEQSTRNFIADLPRHFDLASREAIELLRQRVPMDVWLVSRVEGNEFVVQASSANKDQAYESGYVCEWSRTLCCQMAEGGPSFAASVKAIPQYASVLQDCPIDVESYIGIPLRMSNGALLGTLCGIRTSRLEPEAQSELPLVEFVARTLSRILEIEMIASNLQRESLRRACEAEFDALTNLYNRRGWQELFEAERKRCAQIGSSASVVSIDLDELKAVNDMEGHAAGDELLRRTANAIRFSIRLTDIAARVGGDEFAILLCDCGASEAKKAVRRLESNLDLMDIRASVGLGVPQQRGDLTAALESADSKMRAIKRARKTLDRAVVMIDPALDLDEGSR